MRRSIARIAAIAIVGLCAALPSASEEDYGLAYGVGVVLAASESGIAVRKVLPGAPAERVGVTVGDRLIAVDGVQVDAHDVSAAIAMILSYEPSPVTLLLRRGGDELSVRCDRERYTGIATSAGLVLGSGGGSFSRLDQVESFAMGDSVQGMWLGDPDCAETYLPLASGSPTLLYVWASWCAPCKHLMNEIARITPKRGPHRLRIVGINVDTSCDAMRNAVPALSPPGTQYWAYGLQSEPSQRLRASEGIPRGILVSGGGEVLAEGAGTEAVLQMLRLGLDVPTDTVEPLQHPPATSPGG